MNLKVKVGERAQWTKRHVKASVAGSLGRRARRRGRDRAGGGGGKVVGRRARRRSRNRAGGGGGEIGVNVERLRTL